MVKLLGAIGLLLAAYVIHGLYVYWDARTTPPTARIPRPIKVEAAESSAAAPTLPWAVNYQRLRHGEHAALVDGAWAAPEKDSLTIAAMALRECENFIDPESLKKLVAKIEASPPRERELRMTSLEVLRAPCRALEGRKDLLPVGPLASRLSEAGREGPYNQLMEAWDRDQQGSKDVREARMRAIMATNDPLTIGRVIGRLTRPDATLDGEPIPWIHRGAYLIAWEQVRCVNYQQCYDSDSRTFHLDCVNHGSCDYIGPETIYRILFPMFIFGDRTDEYYRRIQAHLDRRRYEAFGLP